MTGKILIIGDKGKDGHALHEAFKKEAQFLSRIVPAAGTKSAAVIKYDPDVMVLNPDGALWAMSDFCRAVKTEEPLADIPLIAIVNEEELGREMPGGIQDIFCRPLRTPECVARILMMYRKSNRLTGKNFIRTGDLEIDVAKYEVRVGDRKMDLTYTEYELLKFLASHPGNVFSRDVLLNKVWGYEYYGGARTVDVHVRRLRSKIEFKSKRFIETVRNIGYKFISPEDETE